MPVGINKANGNAAIHSCFGPNAWPHEVIYPELGAEAQIREIDLQQWINRVVRRIPTWARGVLKTASSHELEDTCQNFCVTMIKERPDSRFDPAKGSKNAFLNRILVYTHYTTLRSRSEVTELSLDEAVASLGNPVATAEQNELVKLGWRWIAELPESQRVALDELLNHERCACPSKTAHSLRIWRAFQSIHSRAIASGLSNSPLGARRLRFPRSRRIRVPNARVIRGAE